MAVCQGGKNVIFCSSRSLSFFVISAKAGIHGYSQQNQNTLSEERKGRAPNSALTTQKLRRHSVSLPNSFRKLSA